MQIVVDDILTHYQDQGKGKIILLVHGWLNNLSAFDKLTATLAKKYRVIRLDLPGFGSSAARVMTVDQYSDFIAHFLKKLGVEEIDALAGHSMGGQIAIHTLATKKIRAANLIVIAAAGIRKEKELKKQIYRTTAKLFKRVTPDKVKTKLYKAIGSDYSSKLSTTEKQILDNVLAYDVQAEAATIQHPCLLIYGMVDNVTPIRYGERFHKLLKNSRLEILDGSGHQLHIENSDSVASIITDFLNSRTVRKS